MPYKGLSKWGIGKHAHVLGWFPDSIAYVWGSEIPGAKEGVIGERP